MNRLCDKALICDGDPDSPIDDYSSAGTNPANQGPCGAINCVGVDDPFGNYSSEFNEDADFFHSILECACVDDEFSLAMRAPGFIGPFTWDIIGDIPPGLSFNENVPSNGSLTIVGGFLVGGRYEVVIQVTDGWGNVFQRTATFNVLQITTVDLPSPVIGQDYEFQLEASGGSGNYAWKIVDGSLPQGLFMNASGLITGIPEEDATHEVTIRCIDTECGGVDRTFNPPGVSLVGRSTTTVATVFGFDEFTPSGTLPPPRYKRMDWAGFSRQDFLFNTPFNRFPSLTTIGAIDLNYTLASTLGPHGEAVDLREANGTSPCASFTFGRPSGLCVNNPLSPITTTFWHGEYGGVNSRDWTWSDMYANWPPTLIQPTYSETIRQGAVFDTFVKARQLLIGIANFNHNYSRTLSDEYTDAEALANAAVTVGTALVAVNNPRTTGFVSSFTTVDFDIVCVRLMPNTDYLATVTFISSAGVATVQNYPFTTGDGETSHTITDSIPTPPAGQFTLVATPTLELA